MITPSIRTRVRNAIAAWTGIGGVEHVLYVSAESLIAMRHDGSSWQFGESFHLLPENLEPLALESHDKPAMPVPDEFRQWIARWHGDVFRILVDSMDEEVEVDEMPRVRGPDRNKVLERRLKQRFRDAALTTWVGTSTRDRTPLRRAREASAAPANATPGECTMMATLRQRNPMHFWIDAALEAGARVVSIESPALLASNLIGGQGPRPTALVVSVQPAGLRQTLIHNGDIRFTRLLPLAVPAAWKAMSKELERTVRFLMMSRASLRPSIQAGTFPVYVVTDGVDEARGASPIPPALRLDGDISVPIVRLDAKLPSAGTGSSSAGAPLGPAIGAIPTLLRSRARGKPGGYASAELRRNWRYGRSIASIWSLALVAVVATVGANVAMEYAFSADADPAMERQRTARINATRAQTAELEQQIAAMPVNAKEMAGVVELADQLQSRHVDALSTLQWIATGLASDPSLTINDLSWEPQRPLAAAVAPRAGFSVPAPAAAGAPAAQMAVVPGQGDAPATAATTATVVRVAGNVDRSLTKESANRKVDELLARLRASCSCEGKVLEQPYDPSMDVAYSNSLRTPVEDHPPHFTLELQRPSPWLAARQGASGQKAAGAQAQASPAGTPAQTPPARISQTGARDDA